MTDRQRLVLRAICDHWRDHARSPSIRDLCAATGITSPNGVVCHLRALVRKGRIEWERDDTARCIWPAGLRARITLAVQEVDQ